MNKILILTIIILFNINRAESQDKEYSDLDYITVIDYCTKKIKQNAFNIGKYYKARAQAYYSMGKLEKALEDYNSYIKNVTNDGGAFYDRGVIKTELNSSLSSLSDFTNALKFSSDSVKKSDIFFARAFALNELGRVEEALNDYYKSLNYNKLNGNSYNNIGMINIEKKEYNLALTNFNKAIKIDSNAINYMYNKGYALTLLNQYDYAMEELKKALSLSSEDGDACNYMSYLLFKIGKYEESCKYLQKAKAKNVIPLVNSINCKN